MYGGAGKRTWGGWGVVHSFGGVVAWVCLRRTEVSWFRHRMLWQPTPRCLVGSGTIA